MQINTMALYRPTDQRRSGISCDQQFAGRPNLAVPGVSAQDYLDLTLTRSIGNNLRVNLGIENLLHESPPILGSASRDANTDASTHDILGRRYFLRLTLDY